MRKPRIQRQKSAKWTKKETTDSFKPKPKRPRRPRASAPAKCAQKKVKNSTKVCGYCGNEVRSDRIISHRSSKHYGAIALTELPGTDRQWIDPVDNGRGKPK